MDACTTRFAMRMATGPFAISLEAIFLASAIRSVFGTHLVASPICTASGPPILRPKRITSWALPSPISLASLWVPPAPGKSPNPVSGSANNASSDTTRKSQAIAVSQPPPNAYPFTAAITGLEHFWIRSSAFCPAPPKQSVDFFVFRLLRSAPAINAFSPAPVTIITFTSSALSAHVKNWFISAHDRSFKAFIFSGRLAVNTAIPCSSISSLKFWYSIKYETSLHICCYNINYFSVLFHLHIFQK